MENKDRSEEELRFENEFRKLKLQAETGAKFFSDDDKELPASVESDFLDYINAFSEAAERKEFKKVKEVLGYPTLPDPKTLTDQNVKIFLDKAYDILEDNSIGLDTIYEVPDLEIYRFIVEDLFEHEMAIIDAPGMVTQFTYEEFYPNDPEDLKKDADEFINMLCKRSFEFMSYLLSTHVEYVDRSYTSEDFIRKMTSVMESAGVTLNKTEVRHVEIGEDRAEVKLDLNLKKDDSPRLIDTVISVQFALDHGYWCVSGLIWPGLGK